MELNKIYQGNCTDILELLIPDKSIHCCVTSPPYFGLRDYGHGDQIGLEQTPDEYVAALVAVFQQVKRVLRDDGTLWLNLGDSYAAAGGNRTGRRDQKGVGAQKMLASGADAKRRNRPDNAGLKQKDLIGIPWRVAFALQADGWYLRQDIVWAKPNPMPESVRDRCTKSHEYIFLLSKKPKYHYDHDAVKEPCAPPSVARYNQDIEKQQGSDRVPGKTNGPMKAVGGRSARDSFKRKDSKRAAVMPGQSAGTHRANRKESEYDVYTRNKRDVWNVSTKPFKGAHFATFPPELIEPCILAGCPEGGVVLDPFGGAGTVGLVAARLGRGYTLCELNEEYVAMAEARIAKDGANGT